MYNEIKKMKQKELSYINSLILASIKEFPTNLENYFENFLFNSAKRLRPLFIFLICDCIQYDVNEDIYNLSIAIELLHNASLIHDDILDDEDFIEEPNEWYFDDDPYDIVYYEFPDFD